MKLLSVHMEEVRRVGSVVLCGCILVSGVVDPEKYHQIFIHHAIPSEKNWIGISLSQHGDPNTNDPKHTDPRYAVTWIEKHSGTLLVID